MMVRMMINIEARMSRKMKMKKIYDNDDGNDKKLKIITVPGDTSIDADKQYLS